MMFLDCYKFYNATKQSKQYKLHIIIQKPGSQEILCPVREKSASSKQGVSSFNFNANSSVLWSIHLQAASLRNQVSKKEYRNLTLNMKMIIKT